MFDNETQERIDRFMKVRVDEGLKIDPETAEVRWEYVRVMNPYGIYPYQEELDDCIGRGYFARVPGSDIWVHFDELLESTREALWTKLRQSQPSQLDNLWVGSPVSKSSG